MAVEPEPKEKVLLPVTNTDTGEHLELDLSDPKTREDVAKSLQQQPPEWD